ncbi:serine/threonine protein kinase [Acidobacteriota bacterium]
MVDVPEIPGCEIIAGLKRGGMATVFLGIQKKLNRKVAVKILEASLLKDKNTAARFDQETKTAAGLTHSNIIQIFDAGRVANYHYIVMEYLKKTLRDRMKHNPGNKIHPEITIDIIEEMMKALDYAHFRGVYHRDIKPDNIMFRQDSTPVLTDFGIARVFDAPDRLTKSNIIINTINYMSPEQYKAEQDIDGRSDTYSLGVILYEMLTGDTPYKGKSQLSVAIHHIEKPVPVLPGEFSRYQPLIDNMMAKDREKRLSSGPEFDKLLYKILTGSANTASQQAESNLYPDEISDSDEFEPFRLDEFVLSSPEEVPSTSIFKRLKGAMKSLFG